MAHCWQWSGGGLDSTVGSLLISDGVMLDHELAFVKRRARQRLQATCHRSRLAPAALGVPCACMYVMVCGPDPVKPQTPKPFSTGYAHTCPQHNKSRGEKRKERIKEMNAEDYCSGTGCGAIVSKSNAFVQRPACSRTSSSADTEVVASPALAGPKP